MIFIVLGVLFGLIYGIFEEDSLLAGVFLSFMGFIIGIFIWMTVGSIIGVTLPTIDKVEKYELCALNDNNSIQGKKYLFSGKINENLVYRYVINTEKGKHIEEEKIDNAYIKEGNYKPIVKKHVRDFKKDWYYLFAWSSFLDSDDYTEFYVPENTVTNEYNIDLK